MIIKYGNNETDELVHIFVNSEEIITTSSHPFHFPVKGWTEAVLLRAGDVLVLVNGEYVVVENYFWTSWKYGYMAWYSFSPDGNKTPYSQHLIYTQ